jgi:hypothetical protein
MWRVGSVGVVMRVLKMFWRNERGSMVVNLGKASIAIAFLSVIAANWLSVSVNELDRSNGMSYFDPSTTGSLSKRAGETRLDPCALPAKR